MYPAAVDYVAPTSVEEALALLDRHGADGKVIAGGQSLIPLLRLRFAAPDVLIDINRLPGMDAVRVTEDGLRIGALARHSQIAGSELVARHCPLMTSTARQIADPLVRNLGTLGGSLAHADPEGDWASAMLALRASVTLRSAAGERVVPVRDFLLGMFTTVLEPNELLTEVWVPRGPGRSGGCYLKLDRRVGDFATVGVAVQVRIESGGGFLRRGRARIAEAGIALTAVAPSNLVAAEAEAVLTGAAPEPRVLAEAARLAGAAAEPHEDGRGSAAYKRHIVEEYVLRGLERAVELAGVPVTGERRAGVARGVRGP